MSVSKPVHVSMCVAAGKGKERARRSFSGTGGGGIYQQFDVQSQMRCDAMRMRLAVWPSCSRIGLTRRRLTQDGIVKKSRTERPGSWHIFPWSARVIRRRDIRLFVAPS